MISAIEITEDWVKDRVKITKEKLDDIKSLSLPGTFDEKIIDLGSALCHFTRLKELDLSRNVLENLNGLNHLHCLESLNLYYNNVASLKELYKLRNNQKLTQLDLRLNPVARNETDYRLCLIHMLPLLIRLDDRCVKNEERKASLMYFGSDQSREFTPDPQIDGGFIVDKGIGNSHRKTHPRVEMVNRWTRGALSENHLDKHIFDEEDEGKLNLDDFRSSDDNISAPRDTRSVKEYSPRAIEREDKLTPSSNKHKERLDVEREISQFRRSDNISNFSTIPVYIRPDDKMVMQHKYDDYAIQKSLSTNQAHGDGFDINILDHQNSLSFINHSPLKYETKDDGLVNSNNCTNFDYLDEETLNNGRTDGEISREIIHRICDLVDRYWNGSKSLHDNPKFIMSVSKIIQSYEEQSKPRKHRNEDIDSLKMKSTDGKSNRSMIQSNNCLEDNNEDMKLANEALRGQIRDLRQKLHVSEKFIEITDLLKQSHNTLITTNEQLRKQLDCHTKRHSLKNDK